MSESQSDWVRRVLGISLPTSTSSAASAEVRDVRTGPAKRAGVQAKTMPIWRDARDHTGEQISKLQDAMRNSGLPLFARIADAGLNSITETRLVGVQTALMDLDAATGEARVQAMQKARAALHEMRAFLDTNPVIPLLEANPLKVPVTIRATLSGALDSINLALGA